MIRPALTNTQTTTKIALILSIQVYLYGQNRPLPPAASDQAQSALDCTAFGKVEDDFTQEDCNDRFEVVCLISAQLPGNGTEV